MKALSQEFSVPMPRNFIDLLVGPLINLENMVSTMK